MNTFVYCWTDHKTNKLYIGSHKGNPNDGYICSSRTMLKEYKSRPSDFTRQIIAEGEELIMRKFENKLLLSVDAAKNEDFYNKHNGYDDYKIIWLGRKHTDKTKEKISQNHHDISGEKNPMYGRNHTEDARQKMSKTRKGKSTYIRSEETNRKMSDIKKEYWAKRKAASVVQEV